MKIKKAAIVMSEQLKQTQELEIMKIMERISVSSPDSPVCVFKRDSELFAVFGRTVHSDFWIKKGNPLHVGTFDSSLDSHGVLKTLQDAKSIFTSA